MYGKRQKTSYGTALKYDSFHHDDDDDEEFKSKSFRSSRNKRFDFKKQDKRDFQDDEDLVTEFSHLRLVSNYKDLTGPLELKLKEFEKSSVLSSQTIIPNANNIGLKKSKKKKVKLNYHYEDEVEEEMPDLEIKLKTVDSKLKFQKNLPKAISTTTFTKQQTDPIYKTFVKKVQPSTPQLLNDIPDDYTSKYRLVHSDSKPLSRYAATTLLKSRFTSSNERTSQPQQPKKPTKEPRRVEKIEVSDLLKKRLGI